MTSIRIGALILLSKFMFGCFDNIRHKRYLSINNSVYSHAMRTTKAMYACWNVERGELIQCIWESAICVTTGQHDLHPLGCLVVQLWCLIVIAKYITYPNDYANCINICMPNALWYLLQYKLLNDSLSSYGFIFPAAGGDLLSIQQNHPGNIPPTAFWQSCLWPTTMFVHV